MRSVFPLSAKSSKLDRSDQGCTLLRPRFDVTLERRRVAKGSISRKYHPKFSLRTRLMVPSVKWIFGSTTFPNPSTYFSILSVANDMAHAIHRDVCAMLSPGPIRNHLCQRRSFYKGINTHRSSFRTRRRSHEGQLQAYLQGTARG